jgi:2-polyprenyl-6-methoxyphenol hydroxylase-like FAD-dependent oxidoreductase
VLVGDNLTIQPSALSILRHWPHLCKEVENEQYDCWMTYNKHNGEHIFGPSPPCFNDPENMLDRKGPHVGFMQSRVKFYTALIRQTERIGLNIEFGKKVVEYSEDAENGIGVAVLEGGQEREADVVIAADGIKTKSSRLIIGRDIIPKESGLAVYRVAYPTRNALANPIVRERWDFQVGQRPIWEFWLG